VAATHPTLKTINYSNNVLGPKSVTELGKILKKKHPHYLREFRVANLKTTK